MEVGITLMAVWQLSCCCLSSVVVVENLNSIHGSKSYSDLAYKTMKTVSEETPTFNFGVQWQIALTVDGWLCLSINWDKLRKHPW